MGKTRRQPRTPLTVALIGADGSGKTTIARGLAAAPGPVPLRRIYMGFNPAASTHMSPATWLWWRLRRAMGHDLDRGAPPAAPTAAAATGAAAGGPLTRARRSLKRGARLVHQVTEECFLQGVVTYHKWRGRVPLCDRHFFHDYYAHDIAPVETPPISNRLHGLFLARLYPRPWLTILLDAPADVLFARKAEGSIDAVERRRRDYLALQHVLPRFEIVDAARPLAQVTADVAAHIERRWECGDE